MSFWKRPSDDIITSIEFAPERDLGEIVDNPKLSGIALPGHCAIFGKTRSGKTTFAKQLFLALNGYKIFYNIQNDKEIYGMCDVTVRNPSELLRAIGGNNKRINFIPPSSVVDSLFYLQQTYGLLMTLGEKIAMNPKSSNGGSMSIWVTLFCDEAHLVAPKSSRNDPLSVLATRGLGNGIRIVSITQRPSLLSHTLLTQSGQFFIFDISNFELKYFRSYNIDVDSSLSFLRNGKYRFIYTDGSAAIDCDPVKV